MLVIIKSGPDTNDGAIGLTLAAEGRADLVLLQNGVYFAQKNRLGPFAGAVYVLEDDKKLRGLGDSEIDERAKLIGYDELTDIITSGKQVTGMF
ncbi:MAG: DsrH/TusB family sulfur metabolism protein [Nitrospirota bacterium]